MSGSSPEPAAEEEEDEAELEEEELESVQISEKEFNFLDFIKRWGKPLYYSNLLTLHAQIVLLWPS